MALKHLAASFGDVLLKESQLMENADDNVTNIWYWHAMKEIEHKGVAFDVWNEVIPQTLYSYVIRVGVHVIAQLIFWSYTLVFHINMVRKSGKLFDIIGWYKCMEYLWGKPGALRKTSLKMFDYFRPGFHPWQNDNRWLIKGNNMPAYKSPKFTMLKLPNISP